MIAALIERNDRVLLVAEDARSSGSAEDPMERGLLCVRSGDVLSRRSPVRHAVTSQSGTRLVSRTPLRIILHPARQWHAARRLDPMKESRRRKQKSNREPEEKKESGGGGEH